MARFFYTLMFALGLRSVVALSQLKKDRILLKNSNRISSDVRNNPDDVHISRGRRQFSHGVFVEPVL